MSIKFSQFTKKNGIQHVTSSPYQIHRMGCPSREGPKKLTEGYLESSFCSSIDLPLSVCMTGVSLAELTFVWSQRSQLDILHLDMQAKVQNQQE